MAVQPLLIFLVIAASLGCAGPSSARPELPNDPSTDARVLSDVRILVVGRHAQAAKQVATDLQQIGFRVVKDDAIHRLSNDQLFAHGAVDHVHGSMLAASDVAEADLLVLVEVGGPAAYPRVGVKGIDLGTGDLMWQGAAAQLHEVTDGEYDQAVRGLTHRALLNGLHAP